MLTTFPDSGWLLLSTVACLLAQQTCAINNTYPFGFYNISTLGTSYLGFDQIFVCAIKTAHVTLTQQQTWYNKQLSVGQFKELLDTRNITLTAQKSWVDAVTTPYGIKVTSDSDINVYASSSDTGSADGFFVPSLTDNSTEFYVAGWKGSFDSGLLIASAFNNTDVEIYSITNGTNYHRLYSIHFPDDLMTSQIVLPDGIDTTGLYVNSSRPINVFSNVACGKVPYYKGSCDYMVEHIPPVSELGTLHVVPPIVGRRPGLAIGYLVRVVATDADTEVMWTPDTMYRPIGAVGPAGTITGQPSYTLQRSQFIELSPYDTAKPLSVNCSKRCVVMQYNTAKKTVISETAQTDPFMMLTVPADHFVTETCFSTAMAAGAVKNGSSSQVIDYKVVDFDNYLSIITKTPSVILLDGQLVTSWKPFEEFSYAALSLSSGWHTLQAANDGSFSAYVYGHGVSNETTVAYGFPVSYRPTEKALETSLTLTTMPTGQTADIVTTAMYTTTSTPSRVTTPCQQINVTRGIVIYDNPSFGKNETVRHPLQLDVAIANRPQLSNLCEKAYTRAVVELMDLVFQDINSRICDRTMCLKLQSAPCQLGLLIDAGNETLNIPSNRVFVAIDLSSVNNSVTFDKTKTGELVMMHITIPLGGIMDSNFQDFARCRAEIREYLTPFSNWLKSAGRTELAPNELLPTALNCEPVQFNVNSFSPVKPYCWTH